MHFADFNVIFFRRHKRTVSAPDWNKANDRFADESHRDPQEKVLDLEDVDPGELSLFQKE